MASNTKVIIYLMLDLQSMYLHHLQQSLINKFKKGEKKWNRKRENNNKNKDSKKREIKSIRS